MNLFGQVFVVMPAAKRADQDYCAYNRNQYKGWKGDEPRDKKLLEVVD
jgi:hypothetical protein